MTAAVLIRWKPDRDDKDMWSTWFSDVEWHMVKHGNEHLTLSKDVNPVTCRTEDGDRAVRKFRNRPEVAAYMARVTRNGI